MIELPTFRQRLKALAIALAVADYDYGDTEMAVKKKDTPHKKDCVCAACERTREQARIDSAPFPARLYVEPPLEGQPESYSGLLDMTELPDGCLVAVYELRHVAIVRETIVKKLDLVSYTHED